MLSRKHVIQVEFGLPAEFVGNHGLQVPFGREDGLITVLEVLEGPTQPSEAALGVVEGGVWLA